MIKFYKILFFSTMVLGTLIAISSYSWFSMWMGLEINLLSIIPILIYPMSYYSSESTIKYFITQALASSVLLFSIIMIINLNEFIPQNSSYIMTMSMNSALLAKMGAAPFHFWFPEVMEGLNWNNCLIMLTWQKIAPMILLMYNIQMTVFLTAIIIMSSTVGSIIGLNQTSMRKILTYSSINHIGWMIASMLTSSLIWLIYFFIYSIISINIILILKDLNIFQMSQLTNTMNQNKLWKFTFMMNFLSLGGIPPFLGFFPKWLTINNLVTKNMLTLSFILIILTLITLFFYLRVTFSSLILGTVESLIQENKKMKSWTIILNILSLMGLILCLIIFNLN